MRGRQVPCARATAHSTVGPSARVHRKCREPPLWRCTPVFSVYASSARGERHASRVVAPESRPPRSATARRAAAPRFLRLLCGLSLFVCGTAHTNDVNPHKSVGSGVRSGRAGWRVICAVVVGAARMRGRQVPCARATAHSTVGPSARVHRKCREPPLWRCTPVLSVYASSARGVRRIYPPRAQRPPRFRRRAARPRVAPAASRFLRLLCGLASFVCGTAHTDDANPHKSVGSGGPSGVRGGV